MGVLLRLIMGEIGNADQKRYAAVLTSVTQGKLTGVTLEDGRLMLPPLQPLTDDPSEVEEAYDALGLGDIDSLTDELAACVSEEERVHAMAFFIDARSLTLARRVLIHGLTAKPELNGRVAVIAGPKVDGKLRYPVRMVDGGHEAAAVLMRPRNLRLADE